MIQTLENAALQLTVDPSLAIWSVAGRERHSPALENIQIGLHYRRGRMRFHILDRWPQASFSGPERVVSPHGPLSQIKIHIGGEDERLHCTLTFAVSTVHPILLWKLSVENRGSQPIYIDRLELLSAGFIYPTRAGLSGMPAISSGSKTGVRPGRKAGFIATPGEPAFYSNGWQSWSYAGAFGITDHFYRTRLGPIRAPTEVCSKASQPGRRGSFGSEMFGVLGDRRQRTAVLTGFLSQIQHYGSLETVLSYPTSAIRLWANGDGARLDPGARMVTDWACLHFLHLDTPDPLNPYLEAVAREYNLDASAKVLSDPPTGWCSWYQFSTEDAMAGTVTAEDIRKNLAAIAALSRRLPLEVVQIDDGFETKVGDWFSFNPVFPDGLAPLAAEIRSAGLTAGLWLAPFIVHPRSRLAANQPEWLLRGRSGRPVNAGLFWGSFARALDLTHPEALAYTSDVIHTAVHHWGFKYLKLDFLYAASLPGRYRDPTRTRAQVLRAGLETLREAAGDDCLLLGCACPLGPAIGLVDAMRIGADTDRRWRPAYKGREWFFKKEMNLPSARNSSHNAITRAALHRRWWINDPDCLLLRPDTTLSIAEVQTLATIVALTGGSLFLSDHLPDLPPDRLRIAEALLPAIGKRPYILDWFDNPTPRRLQLDLEGPSGPWHLLAAFNWEDQAQDLNLQLGDYYLNPEGDYLAREFWRAETRHISAAHPTAGQLLFKAVPAHGVILLAVRPISSYHPIYLGSDLHISQGLEVAGWSWEPVGRLGITLKRPGPARGNIDLVFPHPLQEVRQDGQVIRPENLADERFRFALDFNQTTNLEFILA